MQSKTPFLFSMPPLFAWLLAVTTSTALIIAVYLVFEEPSVGGDAMGGAPVEVAEPAAGLEESPEATQRLSSMGVTVLIAMLIGSVGLIPMMARRKRMRAVRWSIAGLGTGLVYYVTGGLPLVHPLMVLLALVFLRPPPPQAVAATPDVRLAEPQDAGPLNASAEEKPTQPSRRRPPRRRKRPRF